MRHERVPHAPSLASPLPALPHPLPRTHGLSLLPKRRRITALRRPLPGRALAALPQAPSHQTPPPPLRPRHPLAPLRARPQRRRFLRRLQRPNCPRRRGQTVTLQTPLPRRLHHALARAPRLLPAVQAPPGGRSGGGGGRRGG